MNKIKVLIIIFFTGILFPCAQTKVLDQEYYFIVKNKTIEFKQVKDSLFITKCNGFNECDSLPKFSYLIVKDSIINNKTKVIFVKGQKYKHKNTKIHEKEMTFVDIEIGRKAIMENYFLNGKEIVRYPILYPKSELEKLNPISEITKIESKEILNDFIDFFTSIDKSKNNYDEYKTWEKFNELVIKKGYNPISAEIEIGSKLN